MKQVLSLALAIVLAPVVTKAANPPPTALVGSATTGYYTHSGVFSCNSDSNDGDGNPSTKVRNFFSYTQTYATGHVLNLSFMLDFGHCSLPVVGVFHG
jgi:hypothetical protein